MPLQEEELIQTSVAIHDRTQVEFALNYAIGLKQRFVRRHKYKVDAYFFFPKQTGVKPSNYRSAQFYSDLSAFIRLREPKYRYDDFSVGHRGKAAHESPLKSIQKFMEKMLSDQELKTTDYHFVIEECKFFGCIFKSLIWRRLTKSTTKLRRFIDLNRRYLDFPDERTARLLKDLDPNRTFEAIGEVFQKMESLLKQWREYYEVCLDKSLSQSALDPVQNEMSLTNEYCSYAYRDALMRFAMHCEDLGLRDYSPKTRKIIEGIHLSLLREKVYAEGLGLMWVDEHSPENLLEKYVHRRGYLKKHIWSVLYLDPRPDAMFLFKRQMAAVVGASLAALWAFGASIYIWSGSDFQGFQFLDDLPMKRIFLISGMFVFAYVLKDRIKELTRSLFESGTLNLPDVSNKIYYFGFALKNIKIGHIREYFRYIKWKKLPLDVRAAMHKRISSGDFIEERNISLIRYSKSIILYASGLNQLPHTIKAVHDIIRLNVRSFLSNLDNTQEMCVIQSREGGIKQIPMPKHYYIDVVMRYYPIQRRFRQVKREIRYQTFRIVLNKKGLVRIQSLDDLR